MPTQREYEPVIREGGTDQETINRLGSKADPYPFVKKGKYHIYDVGDLVICTEKYHTLDTYLTDCIYTGVNYFDQISTLRSIRNYIKRHGLNDSIRLYVKQQFHTDLVSATEAMEDTASAIRSIFSKLTEYIRKVSSALSAWMKSVADMQTRSITTIAELEKAYYNVYKHNHHNFDKLVLDIQDGGCPTAQALVTLLDRVKRLLSILNIENNAANIVLIKLIQKAKSLYATGNTAELDEFLSKNEDGNIDKDIIDEFMKLQDKFTGVGISFSEDMAAAFEDVLEYRQESLTKLGYEEDTFKQVLKVLPTAKEIQNCKYLCDILNRLSTYFSGIKVEEEDASDEKYDTYINTIPKILTIIVSVYRTTILAAREYTTIALSIEKSIVEQYK